MTKDIDNTIKIFMFLQNILWESVFIPDTMQEFCRRERYEFSKQYLNKFLVIQRDAKLWIFSDYLDDSIVLYLKSIGLLKNDNIIKKSGDGSLHEIILRDMDLLKKIKEVNCKYIFPYKEWPLTKIIAKKTNKLPLNNYNCIKYLSDKKNIYKLFPIRYLPIRYSVNDLKCGRWNQVVLKPRIWANSRWIFAWLSNDVYMEFKKNLIKKWSFLIQEYVDWDICHSITFITINNEIKILYTAQQFIRKIENNWFVEFDVGNSFISASSAKKYKLYYETILELVREKASFFNWCFIFLVEFIINKDKEIKIMEINPRIGGSFPMASVVYSISAIYIEKNFFVSNRSYQYDWNDSPLGQLLKSGIIFPRKDNTGIIPLNISGDFQRLDLLIVGKDKPTHDYLVDSLNFILK